MGRVYDPAFLPEGGLLHRFTPLLQAIDLNEPAEKLTNEYNALLASAMQATASHLNVNIHLLDAHAIFIELLNDPAALGFTNVADRALQGGEDICSVIVGGEPVANPDEYLWWDQIHITTSMHELLGEAAVDLLACPGKPADINCDGVVNVSDLLLLLGQWGDCPPSSVCPADLNNDGTVNVSDLLILLANWW